MEHQLWVRIIAMVRKLHKRRKRYRMKFADEDIVAVWYWAVIHDRPVSWACEIYNWPLFLRRRRLPSVSTMSRRLRSREVLELLAVLEKRVIATQKEGLFWIIDGKPLPVSSFSKDRQAGYGRAAGGKARGYKLHAIIDGDGAVAAWRVAPMNKDERVMAKRLLRQTPIKGYLMADGNYDSNPLHELCVERGDLQLVTPGRAGKKTGLGHRKHSVGRLRSIAIMQSPDPRFGQNLLKMRSEIERAFGNLTNWGGGLSCLPSWVRTHRRVHRWVQAKMVLTSIKRDLPTRTCIA
jgi:hypothetical protein